MQTELPMLSIFQEFFFKKNSRKFPKRGVLGLFLLIIFFRPMNPKMFGRSKYFYWYHQNIKLLALTGKRSPITLLSGSQICPFMPTSIAFMITCVDIMFTSVNYKFFHVHKCKFHVYKNKLYIYKCKMACF